MAVLILMNKNTREVNISAFELGKYVKVLTHVPMKNMLGNMLLT